MYWKITPPPCREKYLPTEKERESTGTGRYLCDRKRVVRKRRKRADKRKINVKG
jgi:hypothetical protein